MTTPNHVTLEEAADLLHIPVGTLWSWRGRKQIFPAARAFNPDTNRRVNVYELDELKAVQQRHATRPPAQR
jgi:hypothetical protein